MTAIIEKTLSSRRIYEGRALNLRVDTIETVSGGRTIREIVEHAECIVAVPLDEDGNVLLVRQYRKAVEKFLLEVPAGCIEKGETVEDAVRRELQEEIGHFPGNLKSLGGFYSSPGFSTEYLYLFLATDLVPAPLEGEDTAEIEVVKAPLSQALEMIDKGEIQDAKSIAGLLRVLCEKTDHGGDTRKV